MTSGGPDLFVVCKQCRSEVSPYITECPYCGARLRKRAPKLDRDGRVAEPKARRTRRATPSLGRLRTGEIPGIRGDHRPYVTPAVIVASLVMTLLWRTGAFHLYDVDLSSRGGQWWRVFTAPLIYDNMGYAFAVLGAVAIFGWLVEQRHGMAITAVLFLLGGVGGMLLASAAETSTQALGANGAALALLITWAIPDVRDVRAGVEIEGDLLGAGVIGAVLLLMPAFVIEANWIVGGVGVVAGLLVGVPLALMRR
jgi:hypothetical protein